MSTSRPLPSSVRTIAVVGLCLVSLSALITFGFFVAPGQPAPHVTFPLEHDWTVKTGGMHFGLVGYKTYPSNRSETTIHFGSRYKLIRLPLFGVLALGFVIPTCIALAYAIHRRRYPTP